MYIQGLSNNDTALVERLTKIIHEKTTRNMLRTQYMEGKNVLSRFSPTIPDYVKRLGTVLGWASKAVEHTAQRIHLTGFDTPLLTGDPFGLADIVAGTDFIAQSDQATTDALIHSCVFEVVTKGNIEAGEPPVVISHVSALNGTGDYNYRTHRLDNFLAVDRWGKDEGRGGHRIPVDFTLFTPNRVTVVENRRVKEDTTYKNLGVPVELQAFKPRLNRPFGESKISRPIMSITDSAVRTIMRSEGTADVYGFPSLWLFGPDKEAFQDSAMKLIMSRINAIPDVETGTGETKRAGIQQLQQASQEPHVKQLQVWAGLFAGEAKIPVSSLGVGLSQANPTSAESYIASREDLITEAEDTARAWSASKARTIQRAWQIANGGKDIPDELKSVVPVWRDPRFTSRSQSADATMKLVTAFPWMAESDTALELLGFDEYTTRRLKAEKTRLRARSLLDALSNTPTDTPTREG